MNKETVNYIMHYFSHLMTKDEKLILTHHIYFQKTKDSPSMRALLIKKGWVSAPQTEYDVFEQQVVARILAETADKVFFNNCPKCGKLARTPKAQQCRYCGHDWHDTIL